MKDGATGSKYLEELRPSRGDHPASTSASRRPTSEVSRDDGHRNSPAEFVMLEKDLFASKSNQVTLTTLPKRCIYRPVRTQEMPHGTAAVGERCLAFVSASFIFLRYFPESAGPSSGTSGNILSYFTLASQGPRRASLPVLIPVLVFAVPGIAL